MVSIGHTRLLDALTDLARALVPALEADACAISRMLGDVLLFVTDASRDGRSLTLGQGFLVSEFPETQHVLEHREPRAVCLGEAGVDPGEERVLHDLGFSALLMLPLELNGATWGLVEVYREAATPFGAVEIRAATRLLDDFQ